MDWPRKPREQPWKSYDARSTVVKVWSPRSAGGERPAVRGNVLAPRRCAPRRSDAPPPRSARGSAKRSTPEICGLAPWITWDHLATSINNALTMISAVTSGSAANATRGGTAH